MKNILVFGANGNTGIHVINVLREKNYQVLAFCFSKETPQHWNEDKAITILYGNVMDYNDVENAVSLCDAVISVLGHGKNTPPNMQTIGIENIITAMNVHNKKRILVLTGTGVREPDDTIPLYDKIGNFIVKTIDPKRIKDGIDHIRIIQKSNLDYTVLRVLKLSQQRWKKDAYTLKQSGPAEFMTPRQKVAYILVNELEKEDWVRREPVVNG